MTNSVQEAREALGKRLREVRRRAGVTGRELSRREGWHESKVSKIEYGKIKPSDDDIRAYCAHSNAEDQLADLLATVHNIDAAYIEWRQALGAGIKRIQQQTLKLESEAGHIRNWQPQVITGLLQTADYAEAILKYAIDFYDITDDLDQAVSKRMERQQILYRRNHKFHFLIGEQSLYTTIGSDEVMRGQLDRLHSIIGMPRVTLGIVPREAVGLVVVENFVMFDNRMVKIEGHTAGITITQPREIALYGRAFDVLAKQAATGEAARELIRKALEIRSI
ncbi:helix-turn-helix domain-containing protein [Nocardia wallacei]|uniref:helix-turn-helix domain-containing protein n=1 Tax=Nocardia wallacei TaxID=480035 RepID=UPI00245620B4|nr:helix-turn-helix transcriptional regulator [Nocardia wallacei]